MTSDFTIVTSGQYLYQTIVQFDNTIALHRKPATWSIHNYLFCYPLVGILFKVLRMGFMSILSYSIITTKFKRFYINLLIINSNNICILLVDNIHPISKNRPYYIQGTSLFMGWGEQVIQQDIWIRKGLTSRSDSNMMTHLFK